MIATIRLTGRVIGWDDEEDFDECMIEESEVDKYKAHGYVVLEVAGKSYATRAKPFEDGIVQLQPKLDMIGRIALAGRHANYGYSGYFKAYVYLNGKRKSLVDFWTLFPGDGHHYETQQEKPKVEARIKAVIEARTGTNVVKVARGYAFDPVAHAERETEKVRKKGQE
jgi:hypothetical protein